MEAQARKFKDSEKGSALIIVAGVLAVLSIVIDTAVTNFDVGLNIFTAIHEKKQVFYMTEGVRNIATVLLETFLQTNASPTSDDIQTYINANLPALIPAPFTVSPVAVQVLSFVPNAVLTSGPYAGINGPVTTLAMQFTISQPSTVAGGKVVETVNLQLSVAYISMFEFLVFYDNGTAFLQTGPDLNVQGRLHANQDFCVGSDGGYEYLLKVTVAGRLMATNDARCGYVGVSNTKIATDGTFLNFADLQKSYDNGCTNCKGTGLAWQAFSIARWHQQALDSANGVVPLVLPGSGLGLTQAAQVGNWAPVNNASNLRFIIDPVLATDTPTVQSYKFAYNADIRIINGVWYLKDPADPHAWPGVAIWSDHPGRFFENNRDVGQDDIRDWWNLTTYPWPAAPATPTNYSFYAYDTANTTLFDDPAQTGVISYGNLVNTGAVPQRWRPGNWISSGANSPLCLPNKSISCGGGACELRDVWSATQPVCSAGASPSMATQLLNGTRGGFRNGHIQMNSPGTDINKKIARSKLLPVNFDVNQFQAALTNTAPGELGSYFGPGRFKPQGFNGVVFITSVWPGGQNGFGLGGPDEYPDQGAAADTTTPEPSFAHPATQQALPQPLCSNTKDPMLLKPGLAGQNFDLHGGQAAFKIPDCNNYVALGSIQAYPNVIRVINGHDMLQANLPNGLSIVSNLPVYLNGDYNQKSVQGSGTATPWIPSLVAGDRVTMISNAWNDGLARWDKDPNTDGIARNATKTTYNTAMLTDALTEFLEDWTNKDMTVNGSMVLGHNYVYTMHLNYCCGNVSYQPPNRIFNFDPHFQYITNQPPGTPVFPVSATLNWSNPQ